MPCVSACTVLATACDVLIYITKVFTIMPERVLTTRPVQLHCRGGNHRRSFC